MSAFLANLDQFLEAPETLTAAALDRLQSTWFTVYDRRASLETAEHVLNVFAQLDAQFKS